MVNVNLGLQISDFLGKTLNVGDGGVGLMWAVADGGQWRLVAEAGGDIRKNMAGEYLYINTYKGRRMEAALTEVRINVFFQMISQ